MRSLAVLVIVGACSPGGGVPHPLSHLETATITINGIAFEVWLAKTTQDRQRGLMDITADQMGPNQGMLFVFPTEQIVSFFMRGTIIPLDLAYATSDGLIVQVLQLTPLDETPRFSNEPVQFGLELNGGTLLASGIGVGDTIVIPAEALSP